MATEAFGKVRISPSRRSFVAKNGDFLLQPARHEGNSCGHSGLKVAPWRRGFGSKPVADKQQA